MKTMRKCIALLLAALMLCSLLPLSVLADGEAGKPTISLTCNATGQELEVGTAFKVTAALSQNTEGFNALGITLNWNSDVLRFDGFDTEYNEDLEKDVLKGSIIKTATVNNTIGSVQFARDTNLIKDGTLFVANFTVIGAGATNLCIQRENVAGVGGFTFGSNSIAVDATIDETGVAGLRGAALNYELKTLTFEGSKWDALIDAPQYGGTLLYGSSGTGFDNSTDAYKWTDSGNTELFSILSEGYGTWCYWSGGHAVSNYVSGEVAAYGDYNNQLTVYKKGVTGLYRTSGGHDGSNNFAVQYGYADNSGYGLSEVSLPSLSFSDGKARVIDSMWVTNTCYAANCYIDGNNLTAKIGENDWVKIVATGYDGTTKGKTAEFYLCNGPQNIVTDWTKWDLSGLGAVTKVTFNITGSSDNGYGFSQPAYFAFDDVAVRFPLTPVHIHSLTKHDAVTATTEAAGNSEYYSCDCGKYFSDAEGTTEIEADSWVIPKIVPQTGIETKIKFRYGTGKLYAKADTEKTTDYLSGLTQSDNVYTVSVPAGDYVFEGYSDTLFLGSIELSVSEGHSDFAGAFGDHGEILAVTIANSDSAWVYGTDFTFEELSVVSGGQFASTARTVVMGENAIANCKTVLLHEGDTVTFKLVPQGSKASTFAVVSGYKTCNAGYTFLSVTPVGKCTATVTYPYADTNQDGQNDFVLEFGVLKSGTYYIYDYFTPVSVSEPENGTITATFNAAKSTAYFYKVSNPQNVDAVTYGNYGKTGSSAEGTTAFTVTEAQMYIGDSTKNKNTVVYDYSNNEYDSGDLYLASNAKGFTDRPGTGNQGVIKLDTTDNTGCTIYPYRNWLIIESISNAQVIEPDFHVQVINVEGSPITVSENTENNGKKHSFEVKAVSSGTAILLVTYDAVTADQAMGKNGKFFSAIRPENTGVLVVTVNGTEDVEGNMLSPAAEVNEAMNDAGTAATGNAARTAKQYIDAELDRLYFCTDAGASYSFTPEAGTTVTMAKGVQSGSVSFSDEGVSVKNGVVTLSGIPEGKSIVKLVNGDKVSYQVIRATRTNLTVKDSAGNIYYDSAAGTLNADVKFAPGEHITLTYSKLEHPAQKLSGIYNMNCAVVPYGEGISVVKGGGIGGYTFNSTPANWTVEATIPATATGSSYTISALIRQTGFGSYYGQHRELAYETGKSPNFTAVQQNVWYAITSIDLPLMNSIDMTVKVLDQQDQPVTDGTFTVTDAAGAVLTAIDGVYQVYPGKTYSYQLAADGKDTIVSSLVIPADAQSYELSATMMNSAATTWDGKTTTPVTPNADGVYEIRTGAELAWFAAEVNAGTGKSYNAKLMNDVSLNWLSWTPIGTSAGSNTTYYTGTFDGSGHIITDLYIDSTAKNQGLFGYISAATIKNLGVSGYVRSTDTGVAGIVGNAAGKFVIENCYNAAEIIGKQNVGGIAGSAASTGSIKNCYNIGNITATTSQAGGICGGTATVTTVATNCYNAGIVNCPKTGGAINPGAAAKASNSYYLDSCYVTGTSSMAGTAKTEAELKALAATLGDAFAADCGDTHNGGYPILKWQHSYGAWTKVDDSVHARTCICGEKESALHSWNAGVVTKEATKTDEGSRTYTCSVCGGTKTETIGKLVSVEIETTVDNGKATAAVTEAQIADAITEAANSDNIAITPAVTDPTAKTVAVTIPAAAAESVAGGEKSLSIESSKAAIAIPSDALGSIADQAGGEAISVSAETKEASDVENLLPTGTDLTDAVVVEIKITAGDKAITEFGGSKLKLSIPAGENHAEDKTYTVYEISDDTTVKSLLGICEMQNGKKVLSVETTGLSAFVGTTNEMTPYEVTVSGGSTVVMGENASVTVTVDHSTEATYNAYQFVLNYDKDKLEYVSVSVANATVDSTTAGVLKIVCYGTDKAVNTGITVSFKTKATGTGNVTLISANVDKAENANVQNAPAALIKTDSASITAANYVVTLPDGFAGETTAEPGKSYSFEANDKNYDYTLTIMMGGAEQTITPANGVWTISSVIGNIAVTQVSKTGKTHTVTVEGAGKDDAAAADTAAYAANYSFTLTEDPEYSYGVTITIGGSSYTAFTKSGSTYTVPGTDITGDIVITITKIAITQIVNVSVIGNGAADVAAVATAEKGAVLTFTLTKASGYDYSVTITVGSNNVTPTVTENTYTVAAADVTGDVTISVTKTVQITVTVSEYVKLNGKTVYLILAVPGVTEQGKTLKYDNEAMYTSEKYTGYAWLVISADTADNVQAEAEALITVGTGSSAAISYSGDVNGTGLVDVNDAQLVYNQYNAKYDSFDTVSREKFLRADVNGDKTVNVTDASAIVSSILK